MVTGMRSSFLLNLFLGILTVTTIIVSVAGAPQPVPCYPSSTRICVTFDTSTTPGRYLVNTGSGGQPNGNLIFQGGKSYAFQLSGARFGAYPFALTTNPNRATTPWTDGVTGTTVAAKDGDVLIYTPSHVGPQTMYYQSVLASGLGGKISITNACLPSATKICAYIDEETGKYMINTGPGLGFGLMEQGELELDAGTKYTVQSVGDAFAQNPLTVSLTQDGVTDATAYTDAIKGTNPLSGDGQSFEITPLMNGPTQLFYTSTKKADMGGIIKVRGACTPSLSEHHICVRHNGKSFTVNVGDDRGDVEKGDLTLEAGVTYSFEMASPKSGVFEKHSFAICDVVNGPCESPLTNGIDGDNPGSSDDQILRFTPANYGETELYYQSQTDTGMGGKITVVNSCNPSSTNICVFNDGESYLVDMGDGPQKHGEIELEGGVEYTFEIVGNQKDTPFALTSAMGGTAQPILTEGIKGKSVASMDNEKIVFTPSLSSPAHLRYESTSKPNMGGDITIGNTCQSSPTHICVTIKDGNYQLNSGSGPMTNAGMILNAGVTYTFEGQGKSFGDYPFALSLKKEASQFQPITQGVDPDSDNPIAADDNKLVFTPSVVGPSIIYYTSANGMVKGGAIHIVGACSPSKHRVCVTLTPNEATSSGRSSSSRDNKAEPKFVYSVNMGVDGVASPKAQLILNAGEKYTFEMANVGTGFQHYPFAITTDPSIATSMIVSNITGGEVPATGDDHSFTFTPLSQGPPIMYYQSTTTPNMGGQIQIANSCNPSHNNICIYHDGGSPGAYYVDQGEGAIKKGDITMYQGSEYTLEAVGTIFSLRPLSLTTSSLRATTPLTKNVYGDNPLSKDDDKLLFIPDETSPMRLFYQSLLYSGLGGVINILEGPSPYPKPSSSDIEKKEMSYLTFEGAPAVNQSDVPPYDIPHDGSELQTRDPITTSATDAIIERASSAIGDGDIDVDSLADTSMSRIGNNDPLLSSQRLGEGEDSDLLTVGGFAVTSLGKANKTSSIKSNSTKLITVDMTTTGDMMSSKVNKSSSSSDKSKSDSSSDSSKEKDDDMKDTSLSSHDQDTSSSSDKDKSTSLDNNESILSPDTPSNDTSSTTTADLKKSDARPSTTSTITSIIIDLQLLAFTIVTFVSAIAGLLMG